MNARRTSLTALCGLFAGLLSVGVVLTAPAHAADKKVPKNLAGKPQSKVTQTLSPKVYKQMEVAQLAFEAKDYKGAKAALDVLNQGYDKLNDYEKATLWNLYAAVYRGLDDNPNVVKSYLNLLKQKDVPEGLSSNTLFSLAQTYFIMEDYKKSIAVLNKWFTVVQDVQPDAYILKAQAYYQLNDFKNAKEPILKAITTAKSRGQPLKENWLGLLRAVFYELQDYPKAAKVLEALVVNYPKDSYWLQLSGMYGLMGNQRDQLNTMRLAYLGGLVSNPSDILNLARLYLAQEAPQAAVALIKRKMKDKTLDVNNTEHLQLLAQSLALAKETEQSIPVLNKLAGVTGESKHYNFLGQAYSELGQWEPAAEAYVKALNAKDVGSRDSIEMALATTYYNAGKLEKARGSFQQAAQSPRNAEAASNWVKFITTEIDRREQMKAR